MSDLKDLCRELATLDPEWPKPGMRCVDPETGDVWHRLECVWVRNNPGTMLWFKADYLAVDAELATSANFQSLQRAIAAGPDPTDDATVGALLLGLGNDFALARRGGWTGGVFTPYVWVGPVDARRLTGEVAPTDREAIIRAAIAVAKAKVTP